MTLPDLLSFDYDSSVPLDVQVASSESRNGVTIRDLTFASPGGDRVSAYLVLPAESAPPPPQPAILWVHWLEPHAGDSNRTQFLDEAIALAHQGTISVLPDAFWSTTPEQSEGRTQWGWKTNYDHDRDVVIRQVIELRRALDLLLTQPGVDPSRIAYVGHDFGAMVGSLLAAADRRPQSYVLAAGTFSFGSWFVFGSGLTPETAKPYQAQIAVLDPARFIAQAAPARLFFQFATNDFYVPKEAAEMLYNAASEPKQISWIDAGHDLADEQGTARAHRLAWLRQELNLS